MKGSSKRTRKAKREQKIKKFLRITPMKCLLKSTTTSKWHIFGKEIEGRWSKRKKLIRKSLIMAFVSK